MRKKHLIVVLSVLGCLGIAAFVVARSLNRPSNAPSPTDSATKTPDVFVNVAPSKTSGCVARGPLPDPACTPGAVFADVTAKDICVKGYATRVRDVSSATKKGVLLAYGIKRRLKGDYEVDHLISLEIGGSNDVANLWPEPAEPRPGFHEKDVVENYLHREVCAGRMSLPDAQRLIAGDWMRVYSDIKK